MGMFSIHIFDDQEEPANPCGAKGPFTRRVFVKRRGTAWLLLFTMLWMVLWAAPCPVPVQAFGSHGGFLGRLCLRI
jgi:hypothetical protein